MHLSVHQINIHAKSPKIKDLAQCPVGRVTNTSSPERKTRIGTPFNTNMFVEAFHRLLKVVYLDNKHNRRINYFVTNCTRQSL